MHTCNAYICFSASMHSFIDTIKAKLARVPRHLAVDFYTSSDTPKSIREKLQSPVINIVKDMRMHFSTQIQHIAGHREEL